MKSIVACTTLFALLLWIAPSPALAIRRRRQARGTVARCGWAPRRRDERPPHRRAGQRRGPGQRLDDDGLYSFKDLPPGDYSLGIENAYGQMAPVLAPAVSLADDQLARRDLKMMEGDPASMTATGAELRPRLLVGRAGAGGQGLDDRGHRRRGRDYRRRPQRKRRRRDRASGQPVRLLIDLRLLQ